MALYIPAGRRKRNTMIVAAAALVLGVALGWAVGRAQAPTVADRVAAVQRDADDLVSRVGALPIEYEQGFAGSVDSIEKGVLVALATVQHDTVVLLDRAPWIAQSGRNRALDAVAAVKQAAQDRVAPARFATVVRAAQADLRRALARD